MELAATPPPTEVLIVVFGCQRSGSLTGSVLPAQLGSTKIPLAVHRSTLAGRLGALTGPSQRTRRFQVR